MKERPILMSAPMVLAILAGKKTQTRRAIKNHERFSNIRNCAFCCPYGVPAALDSDRLWVRETWASNPLAPAPDRPPYVLYRANGDGDAATKWKPSIFMRRHSSRITLEITDVRVEKLLEISEEDAKAEGVEGVFYHDGKGGAVPHTEGAYRKDYFRLWDNINGPLSHRDDPWVWVLTFRRITP